MPTTPCRPAPRIAARLRRAVRLGPLPQIARAEGRDPRFLTIVLRGALDGLAAVAPVGDPDWIKLRGDNALKLDGNTPALPLDGFFALNPAMPNLHRLTTPDRRSWFMRRRRPIANAPISTARTCSKAASAGRARRYRLAQSRACQLSNRRSRRSANGATFAVGPVTPLVVRGPAPVLSWVAAAASAGKRRHHHAPARSLSPHRSDPGADPGRPLGLAAIERAGGIERKPGGPAVQRLGNTGADLFRRGSGRGGEIPGAARRAARRRARARRLGHPRQ